jgi:hypothetical protein
MTCPSNAKFHHNPLSSSGDMTCHGMNNGDLPVRPAQYGRCNRVHFNYLLSQYWAHELTVQCECCTHKPPLGECHTQYQIVVVYRFNSSPNLGLPKSPDRRKHSDMPLNTKQFVTWYGGDIECRTGVNHRHLTRAWPYRCDDIGTPGPLDAMTLGCLGH